MAKKFYSGVDLASQRAVNAADPTSPADLATKSYVDNLLAGLRWKAPVRVATTTNGTLATAYANGSSVDGVTLVTGDRILLMDQTTGSENGIYTVNASGAPTRATDADSTAELHGATVMVTSGTANGDQAFTQTADNPTVDVTALVWVQVGGGSSYTADGSGIELSGTTFSLELNGATLSKGASGLKVSDAYAGAGLSVATDALSVGAGSGITVNADDVALASTVAGAGLTYTAGVLAVVGASGGGISVAADEISVDTSVVVRKFAQNSPTLSAGTPATITHNLNTRDVQVKIYEGTSGTAPEVEMDINVTGVNTVTVTSAGAQTAAAFRIAVFG